MTLEVDVAHCHGAFALEARFVAEGGLTALFGRSGAGKSSLVDIVAGLTRPQRGRVVVDGRVLVDTQRGVFLPRHRRRVGYVFQEGRLFPHMTVRQNLLYGRWFAPAAALTAPLDQVLALLGIGHLLDRRPGRLSGGEKQRVAIGRALLAGPSLLLMDEPLASLDEARKAEILPYIERLRDELRLPIVYVSHAIAEVARLATTVVALADGKVVAVGPPGQVMASLDLQPDEAGALLDATVRRHEPADGLTLLDTPAGPLLVPQVDLPAGGPLRVRIRSRDVMVATVRPESLSALNVLPGVVEHMDAHIAHNAGVRDHNAAVRDHTLTVRIRCADAVLEARLTRRSAASLGLAPGLRVFAVLKTVSFDSKVLGAGLKAGS